MVSTVAAIATLAAPPSRSHSFCRIWAVKAFIVCAQFLTLIAPSSVSGRSHFMATGLVMVRRRRFKTRLRIKARPNFVRSRVRFARSSLSGRAHSSASAHSSVQSGLGGVGQTHRASSYGVREPIYASGHNGHLFSSGPLLRVFASSSPDPSGPGRIAATFGRLRREPAPCHPAVATTGKWSLVFLVSLTSRTRHAATCTPEHNMWSIRVLRWPRRPIQVAATSKSVVMARASRFHSTKRRRTRNVNRPDARCRHTGRAAPRRSSANRIPGINLPCGQCCKRALRVV